MLLWTSPRAEARGRPSGLRPRLARPGGAIVQATLSLLKSVERGDLDMPRPRLTPRCTLDDALGTPPVMGQEPGREWHSKEGRQAIAGQEVEITYHDGLSPGWYWELLPPQMERPADFGPGHGTIETMMFLTMGRPLAPVDRLVISGPYPTSALAWQNARRALHH